MYKEEISNKSEKLSQLKNNNNSRENKKNVQRGKNNHSKF
jgi:hypothetical protein